MKLKQYQYRALDAYLAGALSVFEEPRGELDDEDRRICALIHDAKRQIEAQVIGPPMPIKSEPCKPESIRSPGNSR